jgi:hypothetical protein
MNDMHDINSERALSIQCNLTSNKIFESKNPFFNKKLIKIPKLKYSMKDLYEMNQISEIELD